MEERLKEHIQTVIHRFDGSFFFYDLDLLKAHLTEMDDILHPDIKLWYACKANPMSAVLKVLRNLGFGIDVASSGEMHQVLNVGIKGENVIATGPGKSKEYLAHLLRNEVKTIVLESCNQAIWLNEVAAEMDREVDALIRVQLDWKEGESVLGGNAITPFGLDSEEWEKCDLQQLENIRFKGFHVFQWGNILDPERLEQIWERTVKEILELSKKIQVPPEILDLGGGLGVPYREGDEAIPFHTIHDILVRLKEKYDLQTIWLELGRFTVAECGTYLTKIVDVKKVRGKRLIVTEGGINHIARVALTSEPFPCRALHQTDEDELDVFQVHGPLCTAIDHLGDFELPADIAIGDWLTFGMAGAYGFTESMPYFLCHKLAGEVLVYNDDLVVPRPPKTSYDWMI